jgi:carbonic anhydrase/acetyltransferase-like protein (isoleucine patch superfamily)
MKNIRIFNNITPRISDNVFIDPTSVITGDVIINKNSSIWPHTSIRGDLLPIIVGSGTNIQDGSVLHTTHKSKFNPNGHALTIGSNVTIGHRVTLHGCIVEDSCLIGMNSCIMDGVIIEKNTLVAAGSLVTPGKTLKSGFLYRGSPAKQIRKLSDLEIEFFNYSAKNYIKLKDQHISSLNLDAKQTSP